VGAARKKAAEIPPPVLMMKCSFGKIFHSVLQLRAPPKFLCPPLDMKMPYSGRISREFVKNVFILCRLGGI